MTDDDPDLPEIRPGDRITLPVSTTLVPKRRATFAIEYHDGDLQIATVEADGYLVTTKAAYVTLLDYDEP